MKKDGRCVLTCVRPDGTRTWQHVHAIFPTHDLTHLAVEATLGIRDAFFGLVERGWSLSDFAAPGAAARLPREAVWVEVLVGVLQTERADRTLLDVTEFNATLSASAASVHLEDPRRLTSGELERIRAAMRDLYARWSALPPGETLRLEFAADPGVD
ncbi:MAG: hypothetical protein HYR85_02610 [Planctomycetes bacterium]|nr:hypothetical protein [Planctomycetota bacterium]MBI3847689.1 hypothetical protein [Planctomycetota bacterium]